MRTVCRLIMKSPGKLAVATVLAVSAAFGAACSVFAGNPNNANEVGPDLPRLQCFGEDGVVAVDVETVESPAYGRVQIPSRQLIEEPVATAAPEQLPRSDDSMTQPAARSPFIRWLPEGVVPILGPRTPDSRKVRGVGIPLQDGGWHEKPFSISGFSGASNGGPLIPGQVFELPSYYGGLNFGWDYDHYWGTEKRIGFGALNLANAQHQPLPGGFSMTAEYRLMYYPLGDARWRPFITSGVGVSDFYFQDGMSQHHHNAFFVLPFGGGLKYRLNERWALRIDMIDELTFKHGTSSPFHYVALTAGLELRFGKPLLHWPWRKSDSR